MKYEIINKEKKELEQFIRSREKNTVANTDENINDLLQLSNEELNRSSKIISEVIG